MIGDGQLINAAVQVHGYDLHLSALLTRGVHSLHHTIYPPCLLIHTPKKTSKDLQLRLSRLNGK